MKIFDNKRRISGAIPAARVALLILAAALLIAAPSAAQVPAEYAPKGGAASGVLNKVTIMAPMRDGVKLATDIYFPGGAKKKMPAILMRTPYGKKIGAVMATFIIGRRYAWVVQDTRGRHDSEGVSHSFLDDVNDGYDTVEWIVKQPWCDGRVGTIGISAMGIAQYVMAANPSPHLKSQYVMAAAGSLYHDAAFTGGGFRRGLVIGWVGGNDFPVDFLETLLKNPDYNALWRPVNLHDNLQNITYPMLHMGGWYDIFLEGNIRAFEDVQANGAPGARGRQHLIVGPWTHMGWGGLIGTKQGALKYPENSKYDIFKGAMNWFDETIKGKSHKILSGPAVEYYVMGDPENPAAPGNVWRKSDKWPPYDDTTPYYFHQDGTLDTETPSAQVELYKGNLVPDDKRLAASMALLSDPENPVQTIGGALLVLPNPGPRDQRESEKRSDVLVFTTSALEEPLEVTGKLRAVLYISTDVPDTDFAVKLTDVYPDGRSMLVADGLIRASHRDGSDHRAPALELNKIYELTVDVTDTSIIFNKGHRIRVDIAGSNFPRFDINQNNGEFFDLAEDELKNAVKTNLDAYIKKPDAGPDARVAHDKLYIDPVYPSHFLLPVVKNKAK